MKSNSVRLRLTQTETARLVATGWVEEMIEFGIEPYQQFSYRLETNPDINKFRVLLENNRIIVSIPKIQAETWGQTEQVGIKEERTFGGEGKVFHLLIEKDFACLEPRPGEDETDSFPHPLQGKVC